MSKRAEIRERRALRRSRQRWLFVGVILAAALVLVALLVYPSFAPVGDIVQITPEAMARADGTAVGDPNAPVLIELYEDFQCPACRAFSATTVPRLIQYFVDTGQARLIFRQYPFIGSESMQAANASLCANEQGRFWDYHDILWANQNGENQGAFTDRRLIAFAESLGLEAQAFRTCFDSHAHQTQIDSEQAAGQALGVYSTPSILINGKLIVDPVNPRSIPSYDLLAAEIGAALAGPTP
jgi:protein-disulfide isomerase